MREPRCAALARRALSPPALPGRGLGERALALTHHLRQQRNPQSLRHVGNIYLQPPTNPTNLSRHSRLSCLTPTSETPLCAVPFFSSAC